MEDFVNWLSDNANWIFSGIGTTIVGFIIGWVTKGYHVSQSQRSGDNSSNIQVGRDLRRKD
jgi:hypothetical protein